MDTRSAIAKAKSWISDIYSDEGIRNVGLEEIRFDDGARQWLVTIGFSRPWDSPKGIVSTLADVTSRSYKLVRIDEANGEVISVENRSLKS